MEEARYLLEKVSRACYHHVKREKNKTLKLLSNFTLVFEIFYLTAKHLFAIDATDLGWNQVRSYLAKEGIAAEVEVHCTTGIELFAWCLAMSHHQNSVKRTETAALMLYMSMLCTLGLSFRCRLAFKVKEDKGKQLVHLLFCSQTCPHKELQASKNNYNDIGKVSALLEIPQTY